MGGKSAPDPPDYSGISDASLEGAKMAQAVAQEQLDFNRQMWSEQQVLIREVLDTQLPLMKQNAETSMEDRERYERLYQPLEEEYLAQASEWDSPERRDKKAAQAQTEVAGQFEAQRKNALQNLDSYGVNRGTTRFAALDLDSRIQQATAQAQAAQQQRDQAEREGIGMKGEAINVGRGLASQGLNYAATGLQAADAASRSGAQWQGASNAMGSPTAWNQAAQSGYGTAGSIMNTGYGNQLKAFETEQANSPFNTLAGIAGTGLGVYAGMAEGGEARAIPTGEVSGPGGPKDDAIPARLSDGEFVIPEEVVRRKGTEFFDKLIAKTQEELSAREQTAQVSQHAMAIPPPGAAA